MSHKSTHNVRTDSTKLVHITRIRGALHYNRRVPEKAVESFGKKFVRLRLPDDEEAAVQLAERLSEVLDATWSTPNPQPIDLVALVRHLQPKRTDLLSCLEEYLSLHDINPKPSRLAVGALVEVAGNKTVEAYTRQDARAFVSLLRQKGNKTATVRRRLQSLHAIIEYGLVEQGVEVRNPFSRLKIPHEGSDSHTRQPFSQQQLEDIYSWSFEHNRDTTLILPILGDTGARLAEVVGLRWKDVCLDTDTVSIAPHPLRRLKTQSSVRVIPLVGAAREALFLLKDKALDTGYVFPRWKRDTQFVATHASNTLNKTINRLAPGQTCHCFRHTMRDRLRAVEAPMDLIDQVQGWSSKLGAGAGYGSGYSVEHARKWMRRITSSAYY